MNRDLIYLLHIIECIEKIEKATKSKTKKSFEKSGIVRDGIFYNLQIMSESTQKVSKSLKLTESEIPWSEIAGFRNKLVHEYLGIDSEVVWDVIKKKLPILKKRVMKMLEFLEKKEKL
jgi:uncharacterized protein with HEPN domain